MKNATTKKVTISSIIARADFRDGMADYYAGRPIKDHWESTDRFHTGKRQWDYERGRLYACYLTTIGRAGMKIKDARRVTQEAVDMFKAARTAGFIF